MTVQIESKRLTVLNGRYTVEQVLREGEASTVYLARDNQAHRTVVVKTADAANFDEASVLVHEREVLMRLDHPGIVRCLDFYKCDGQVGLVLEHVPGQDLEQVLTARKRIDENTARDWAVQLADIITVLHEQRPPILYRDLKPSNVVLRPDGRLVLVDFGAARLRNHGPKDTVALGTPGYAPPEQYGQGTDERADVYTLGVTLFELLSGRDPRDFGFAFPPMRELEVEVSAGLDAIVQKAVQRDAKDRYASIQAMRAALRAPRRNVASLVIALCAAAAYAVGVVVTPEPMMRFIFGATAFVCAAWAGLLRLDVPTDGAGADDRPSWQTHAARIAVVLGAALLGAAPLVLPAPAANAHLRRLLLDTIHRPVPVDGSPAFLFCLVLFFCVLGFLCGRAFTRRLPWPVPVGLAAFTAVLLLGHVALNTRTDNGGGAAFNDPAPLWTKVLGTAGAQSLEVSALDGPAEGGRVALRMENEYRLLDASNGADVFSGTTEMREPLRAQGGIVVERQGQRITGRQISDGKEKWHVEAGKPITRVMQDADAVYVISGPTIESLNPATGVARWTWNAPDGQPALALGGGFAVGPRGGGDIFMVASRDGHTLMGLDRTNGVERWKRALDVTNPEFSFPIGNRRAWLSQDRLMFLDMDTGKTALEMPLPASTFGGIMQVGENRYIVSRGDGLMGIDGTNGSTLWTVQVPAERLRVMQVSPTGPIVQEAGGRLMRLDPDTGRVAWEWWPGDLTAHVIPSDQSPAFTGPSPHALFVQAQTGGPLYAVDGDAGALAWRHAVEPGTRVVRAFQGLNALLLLTSNARQEMTLTALPSPAELIGRRTPMSLNQAPR